jgi:cystathionine gamma-synthase
MKEHERNARLVAEFLDQHPGVARVYYPGLPAHPGHELAKRQQFGYGGMVSFEVNGGIQEVHQVLRRVKIFAVAESLGGVESLISHSVSMTHVSMNPELRAKAGINERVLRLSVGIEDPEDLLADLDQALQFKALAQVSTPAVEEETRA